MKSESLNPEKFIFKYIIIASFENFECKIIVLNRIRKLKNFGNYYAKQ